MLPFRVSGWIASLRGQLRPLFLLLAPAVLVTSAFADAQKLPSPANSTVPMVLTLVGRDAAGTADPIGEFDIVVRDLANLPKSGVQVVLDFTESTDTRLCTDQSPTGGADCDVKCVVQNGTTGSDGIARFRVVGWSDHASTPTQGQRLHVFADGVVIRYVAVAALDQEGNGVGASDLSKMLDDVFHSPNAARSDLNGDGSAGAADLALWLAAFFADGSILGAGSSSCPH